MKKSVKLILPVILLTFIVAGGIVKGDDYMGTTAASGTSTISVCLPPAWSLKLPTSTRFETVLDGQAVLDWETGLVWEKSPNTTPRTWGNAVLYAYKKMVGGRKGWRLPTVEELASIVDTSVSGSPKLPSGHPFTNVQSSSYWSSTTLFNETSIAWCVDFDNGYVDAANGIKSEFLYVWCVRGGHSYDGRGFE
jgi:hypothetical protein